jgi:signal peptidase II
MKYRYFFISATSILLLDRIAKIAILISKNDFIKNPGVAFGLGKSIPGILFFLIALGLVVLIYLSRELDLNKISNQIALGLIFGGGISNILDRLFYKGVIDYIDIFSLSAFNLADVGIFTGSIILLIYFFNLPEMKHPK